MDDDALTGYHGGETTGFQSPAQDHIEQVLDLAELLDLRAPGIYPVRVAGSALSERGILDGDILIVNTAGRPSPGQVAVAFVHGGVVLATLHRLENGWGLKLRGQGEPVPVSDEVEIWAIVAGLVRTDV